MSRHSQNATSRSFFTYHEKQKAGLGSIKNRLGEDSQRKFDQCNLCLGSLVDPVASPYGYLYCRECILGNLLSQKQALDEQRRAYEAEQAAIAAENATKAYQAQVAEIERFEKMEHGVGSEATSPLAKASSTSSSSAAGAGAGASAGSASYAGPGWSKTSHDERARIAETISMKRAVLDTRTAEEKAADVARVSFWTPDHTPHAAAGSVAKPDPAPRDPTAGGFLRAKQLIKVSFTPSTPAEADASAAAGGAGNASRGRFSCPACVKPIIYQKTYMVKGCGHVTCDKCTSQFVVPSKACFVCSAPVAKKDDIMALQRGGSSFVAHEGTQAEAKQYRPGYC